MKHWKRRDQTAADKRREVLRAATAVAQQSHTAGGRRKTGALAPKPVTLPKLKFLEGGS